MHLDEQISADIAAGRGVRGSGEETASAPGGWPGIRKVIPFDEN
jgi:hypothetical protein